MRTTAAAFVALLSAYGHPFVGGAKDLGATMLSDTTFTVNTVDDLDDGNCDLGHCSLREALNAANGNAGTDTVAFDIPGTVPHRIKLTASLPTVSEPIVIDGTTEPDFSSRPIVELDGARAGPAASGLRITAGGSTVRGLVINNFGEGIRLEVNGGNVVEGNTIGTDFRALVCEGNSGSGVWVASPNNTIGGTTQTDANIIVCSGSDGIYVAGGAGNTVRGNFIGTEETRSSELPNARDGLRIDGSSDNTVGGSGLLDGNYVNFNAAAGISIRGAGSTGNLITGNTITGNGGDGVELPDAGAGNRITDNSIDANAGLGIDLGPNGVTPNDPGDSDTGPNELQNYPDITTAVPRVGTVYVEGTLASRAGTSYDVEFFVNADCNASDHGEGRKLAESATLTTDGSGTASFALTLIEDVFAGDVITGTATDPDGNTSEFSACVVSTTFTMAVSPDSVIVVSGVDAKYAVDLTAVGGSFDLPVQLACSDLPTLAECSFEPSTVTPGSGTRSILTVSTAGPTGAAGADVDWRSAATAVGSGFGLLAAAALPGLAVITLLLAGYPRRRSLRFRLTAIVACLGLAVYTGCGDDGPTDPTNGGTPSGRYEFTIEAASGPVTLSDTGLLIVR
jgi:CSLREA domain-containing protein